MERVDYPYLKEWGVRLFEINYSCIDCDWNAPKEYNSMICKRCGGDLKSDRNVMVLNSRDAFWRDNPKPFYHTDDNGRTREITNFKSWEKAGYRDAISCTKDSNVRRGIKRKVEKIKKYDSKNKFSVGV